MARDSARPRLYLIDVTRRMFTAPIGASYVEGLEAVGAARLWQGKCAHSAEVQAADGQRRIGERAEGQVQGGCAVLDGASVLQQLLCLARLLWWKHATVAGGGGR